MKPSRWMDVKTQQHASSKINKKIRKKEKKKKKKTQAMKQKYDWRVNTYYEMTPFIVFICNKVRVHDVFLKSKLQIM